MFHAVTTVRMDLIALEKDISGCVRLAKAMPHVRGDVVATGHQEEMRTLIFLALHLVTEQVSY